MRSCRNAILSVFRSAPASHMTSFGIGLSSIIDTSGNVIAFGGRSLDDTGPKYLNSSDTPGFKKSRNLYALNFARKHCAEAMILCEGYMDVIALHAAGFENAVATLGTAITPEQVRVMARYTRRVIISYDSDEAGQNAADKAMRLLGEVGLEVRVLKLSEAKDPDEYIKKYGKDKFRMELESSRSGFEHKFFSIIAKYDTDTAEGKIKAAGEVCRIIAEVGQSVDAMCIFHLPPSGWSIGREHEKRR